MQKLISYLDKMPFRISCQDWFHNKFSDKSCDTGIRENLFFYFVLLRFVDFGSVGFIAIQAMSFRFGRFASLVLLKSSNRDTLLPYDLAFILIPSTCFHFLPLENDNYI